MLAGLAYVVHLLPEADQGFGQLLPNHRCFNGAVRVYLPGYSEDDEAARHRVWLVDQIQTKGETTICDEIAYFVATHMLPHLTFPDTLTALEQEQQEERVRKRVQVQIARGRQQIRQQNDSELEAMWTELVQEYESIAARLDTVTQENYGLQHKVQALQWQLRQKSDQDETLFGLEEATGTRLLLSSKAKRLYEEMENSEQTYWEKNMFPKLLDDQLRESQSDVFRGNDGVCWVYPRDRSAGGRRVIYVLREAEVRVCEIFTNHDNYEAMRNQGIGLINYTDFDEWILPS